MSMNNTSTSIPGAVARRSLPPLVWGVGGVMATAIVALASTVAYQRGQISASAPAEASAPVAVAELPASAAKVVEPEAVVPPPPVTEEPAKPVVKAAAPASKPRPAAAKTGISEVPPPPISNSSVSVADSGRSVPPPPISAAPQICSTCGIVESVEPYQVEGQGSGAGAIAGGAVGAVVGNQFGKGGGRTASRLLGAVGGALIGNQIEKHAKTQTLYRVRVKMEDGSRRVLTEQHPVDVGASVTVQGEHLQRSKSSSGNSGAAASADSSQNFNADGR